MKWMSFRLGSPPMELKSWTSVKNNERSRGIGTASPPPGPTSCPLVVYWLVLPEAFSHRFISPAPPSALSTSSSSRDRGVHAQEDVEAFVSAIDREPVLVRHTGGDFGGDVYLDAAVGIEFVAGVLTSSPLISLRKQHAQANAPAGGQYLKTRLAPTPCAWHFSLAYHPAWPCGLRPIPVPLQDATNPRHAGHAGAA